MHLLRAQEISICPVFIYALTLGVERERKRSGQVRVMQNFQDWVESGQLIARGRDIWLKTELLTASMVA